MPVDEQQFHVRNVTGYRRFPILMLMILIMLLIL